LKSVVCFLWGGNRDFRPAHVNVLARMVARHLPEPHRFICITDETEGFDPGVEVMPTPPAASVLGNLRTPEKAHFPSCYRRLWLFSAEAKCLGERVLLLDIDLVVTGDLRPLFEHPGEFVGWRPFRDWGRPMRFGGGIYLLTPGTRTQVWDDFTGPDAIAQARAAGFRGSDQAWISYKLGASDPYWDRASGIYSVRDFKSPLHPLPSDARLVQLNGPAKPWGAAQAYPWVKEHWR
jgi:hypothetical protein